MGKYILSKEFLRMQKLAGIITENNIYEEQEPDFSLLSQLDDLIGDELEKAEKEFNAEQILMSDDMKKKRTEELKTKQNESKF